MTMRIQRFASELPLPFSKAVRAGGFLFLSGQVAERKPGDGADDVATQADRVLNSIAATLSEHGCSMADVVRASVWLVDLDDFPAFNKVYAQHFAGHLPTRSTVQARLAGGALVEIEVQALAKE